MVGQTLQTVSKNALLLFFLLFRYSVSYLINLLTGCFNKVSVFCTMPREYDLFSAPLF